MAANAPRPRLSYRRANFAAGEFRLLELQRATDINDRLVCKVITANLKDDVEFIALSSLYGDTTVSEYMYIDNQRIPIPVNIATGMRHVRAVFLPNSSTSSAPSSPALGPDSRGQQQQAKPEKKSGGPPRWLVHALRHVRSIFPSDDSSSGERPLRLWFDAMCIDHNNAKETQHQLVHMTQVYGKAKVVVGWLGPADENSEVGIDTIKLVNEIMPPNWGDDEDRRLNPHNYSPQHEWWNNISHFWAEDEATADEGGGKGGLPNNPNWLAVAAFLQRDYFNRHWILTEIGRARYPTFLAGTKILNWKHILRLTRLIEEMRDTESDVFPARLRPVVHQFPLGIVYDFLAEFDKRQKAERLEKLQSTQRSDHTTISSEGCT